jgi:hypothetical protein
MSCERYGGALTDVAAGGPVPAEVEAHLDSCERCREELAGLRRVLAIAEAEMGHLVAAEPSPGLAARIRQSVATSDSSRAWRVGWLWPATAASAALLVAVAIWMVRATSPAGVAVDGRPAVTPRASRPAEEGSRTSEVPEPTATSPRARALVPPREGSEAATLRHPHRAGRAVAAAPEVLVPPGEAEALVRFAAEVQRHAVTLNSILLADLSAPLTEPKAIEIAPLEIEPLSLDTGTD